MWWLLPSLRYKLESGLFSGGNKHFWTQVLSQQKWSACWLGDSYKRWLPRMWRLWATMKISSPSCCGNKATGPEAIIPLASWAQVQPLPGERGSFSPNQLVVNNPQRAPGWFHKPHPWKTTSFNQGVRVWAVLSFQQQWKGRLRRKSWGCHSSIQVFT